jgi:hypothetical protein
MEWWSQQPPPGQTWWWDPWWPGLPPETYSDTCSHRHKEDRFI